MSELINQPAEHSTLATLPHESYRVRHPLKIRSASVQAIEDMNATMRRITFVGDDLSDFVSASFDDHVKVFLPDATTGKLHLPHVAEQGVIFPEPKPLMRDYTPRFFNHVQKTLTIDFVLHDAGPASDWAKQAKIGDQLGFGGPRGSMVTPMDFDGYVLIGDDTALPAIGRRLEELPDQAKVLVIAEVDSANEQLEWHSKANVETVWLHRSGEQVAQAKLFLQALKHVKLPHGEIYIWVATETNVAREIRKTLINDYHVNKKFIKAAGYWQQGKINTHEVLKDE